MSSFVKAIITSILLTGILGSSGFADDQPNGRVILEIASRTAQADGTGLKRYDLEMIESLGMTQIVTETPWTDGLVSFTGVLARDLISDAGLDGDLAYAIALNDYSVEIPLSDFSDYDVILATQKDGEHLTIRDRGPLWVIYPWSERSALQNELYYSRSIWQLRRIEIE